MRYLVTGHTGFKGSWLTLILQMLGHEVSGISLSPPQKSLFVQAKLEGTYENDFRIDIRNKKELTNAIHKINPEVIIHLAAQPLVRDSFNLPVETFEINVIGTLNVLEATKELKDLKAALIITTDKVYKNHNQIQGYVETDQLGGDDPYSASKAAADIATQSWIKNFAHVPIAIARAGNVIGGGDWAKDRIIPDLVTAYTSNQIPTLRYPEAIRPWQHVLDCLNGYLMLVDHMIKTKIAGEWNFGPDISECFTVGELSKAVAKEFNIEGNPWDLEQPMTFHEAGHLLLDSNKARKLLGWREYLNFHETIKLTCNWYKNLNSNSIRENTKSQIDDFFSLMSKR